MTDGGDPLGDVWAKSAAEPGKRGETLTGHTAVVLGRLAQWRDRSPRLADRTTRSDLWELAAWAVCLHDLGKCARGFQAMLRGGPRFEHRHEVLSLGAVGMLDIDDASLGLVAIGVVTHHKNLPDIETKYPFGQPSTDQLLAELSPEHAAAWPAWITSMAPLLLRHGFAPLPRLRDASVATSFRRAMTQAMVAWSETGDLAATDRASVTLRAMRGLLVLADHAGSAHEKLRSAPSFASVASFTEAAGKRLSRGLEPHQLAASQTDGHALLVAPTGSGKTEAALLWAARQREQAGAAPLFYVLPYRASLNAMRERLESYGLGAGDVVLQHATSASALYAALLSKEYAPSTATLVAKRERALGKLMTAPVRVLTPYQLVRAVFGLPGHESVLTDASEGAFVLDELHAYDVPRLALILATLRHLTRDLGARVLSMSATFPRVLSDALAMTVGKQTRIDATAATQARFVRHTLRLHRSDLLSTESLNAIVERAEAGEAVLVVATTVARAQSLFDAVTARLSPDRVELLHGRFTNGDRSTKERRVAERLKTGADRAESSGTVLVATQVVEVSLDVDFDVLFSDPAPIEALLQRFGRVNRGMRGGTRDVFVATEIPDVKVYEQDKVERALSVLATADGQRIEESAVQGWVDAVYEPIADRWMRALSTEIERIDQTVIRTNRPLEAHPELRKMFDDLFDGQEVIPAALRGEAERILEEEPLRAPDPRIAVSPGQLWALKRGGLLDGEVDGVPVTTAPYDDVRGLDLTAR